ncbi:YcaO-like family protein [Amphritea sp. 1_MG-2023]|uniref:YcaO-like family protein n=1 Tax=Amphritea sp. 1_MG-2023 TaxID=3062670 RepID=UPI0026E2FFA8|nr:YcaO-like family protein [Amphritea sp. 1_MG-2023]MDO6562011.1 YcaO-like family protein [Amphritea sp. 1_MG-2023]
MTTIAENVASVNDSVLLMSRRLQRLGLDIEEVRWLNPAVHVWRVELRDRSCPWFCSQGQGITREVALKDALRVFFERLSCHFFFMPYFLGQDIATQTFVYYPDERWFPVKGDGLPEGLLDEPTLLHYTVNDELKAGMLLDAHTGYRDGAICAIPFIRQLTGDEVWMPINIIRNLYVGNGMAAGDTVYEARVEALAEIFQRHIKNTIISSGISLPDIPSSVQQRYPAIVETLDALRAHGFTVLVKDASLGGRFPLINVTLINSADGGCRAAFGAHPKFETAFQRAVLALLSVDSLDDLSGCSWPSFDLSAVADQQNLDAHLIDASGTVGWDLFATETDYDFTEWNIDGDANAEFDQLCHLIHEVDMDIYIADYHHLGVNCCRIIVPGMSEVRPVDVMMRDNRNVGDGLRQLMLKLPTLDDQQVERLLLVLEEAGFDDSQRIVDIIGIVPDNGSVWQSLRVAELKCLLNLHLGELSEALIWSDGLQRLDLPAERARLYRCLHQCLMFRLDQERPLAQYHQLLNQIYGADCVNRVLEMIDGHGVFACLSSSTFALEEFTAHGRMLALYARLQAAKAIPD